MAVGRLTFNTLSAKGKAMTIQHLAARIRRETNTMTEACSKARRETCNKHKVKDVKSEIRRQCKLSDERGERRRRRRRIEYKIKYRHRLREERIRNMFRDHATFAGNYEDRNNGDQREVSERRGRIALVYVCGWINYTRSYGTYVEMSGLVFHQPAQEHEWAFVRVPPSTRTIDNALESLKPVAVKKAETAGRIVLRQGDLWVVQQRVDNMKALPPSHVFDAEKRVLRHNEHGDLSVPFQAKVYQMKSVANGRRRFVD